MSDLFLVVLYCPFPSPAAGYKCQMYNSCKDAPFPDYVCPKGFKCVRQTNNKWYWQCIKA